MNPSKAHRPMRAAGLRKGRRHGVPRTMIERAAERRLAGDWLGACAAADVAVDLDLRALRREHGAEFTDRLLDDLHHLVPDLLRWHFPRFWHGDGRLLPGQRLLLSRPGGADGPWLSVHRTDPHTYGHRRLVLKVAGHSWSDVLLERCESAMRVNHWENLPHVWETSRYLWDARHVHEARERWGGSAERAPFLNPDGTPRTSDELPATHPGPGDRAARTEWIDGLHRAGRVAEAFAAAGIVCDPGDFPGGTVPDLAFLSPALLSAGFSRLTAAGGPERACVRLREGWGSPRLEVRRDGDRIRLGHLDRTDDAPLLPEALWKRPPDLDVLRDGLSPDHLHPLLREALAPARPPVGGPVGPPPWAPLEPFRVRCGGEWHTVELSGGRLNVPHRDEDLARETVLGALGGPVSGCLPVLRAWEPGYGRLPKARRLMRVDLFRRIRSGDTDAVVAYLASGGDPRIRDGAGLTLLHHLAHTDHAVLLPRLLAAGLDVDAEAGPGVTPLYSAVRHGGDTALVRALIAAGARTDGLGVGRHAPESLASIVRRHTGWGLYPDAGPWEELLAELSAAE